MRYVTCLGAFLVVTAFLAGCAGRSKPEDDEVQKQIRDLLPQLSITNVGEVKRTTEAFTAIGEPAVPYLVDELSSSDGHRKENAALSLSKIGSVTIPALTKALEDEDKRTGAALALGKMGPAARGAMPEILKYAGDGQENVRKSMAFALGAIGGDTGRTVPCLVGYLRDARQDVRFSAMEALGELGPGASAAIPTLIAMLPEDPDLGEYFPAAVALCKIGPASVEPLREALKNEDQRMRCHVLMTLELLGAESKSAIPDLMSLLVNQQEKITVRICAASALGMIGPHLEKKGPESESLRRALKEAGEDEDSDLRDTAGHSLELILRVEPRPDVQP